VTALEITAIHLRTLRLLEKSSDYSPKRSDHSKNHPIGQKTSGVSNDRRNDRSLPRGKGEIYLKIGFLWAGETAKEKHHI
jgi:hypothetical protein